MTSSKKPLPQSEDSKLKKIAVEALYTIFNSPTFEGTTAYKLSHTLSGTDAFKQYPGDIITKDNYDFDPHNALPPQQQTNWYVVCHSAWLQAKYLDQHGLTKAQAINNLCRAMESTHVLSEDNTGLACDVRAKLVIDEICKELELKKSSSKARGI